ncbi:hypothetical protein CBF23_003115 [Marinomonas agarivorans]|nr:hypothetical protein CBF23_003115 [Marinomonas agarivorans]
MMFFDDYEYLKPRKGDEEYSVYEPVHVDGKYIEIPVGRAHVEGELRGIAYIEIAEGNFIVRRKKSSNEVPLYEMSNMHLPESGEYLH